MLIEDGHIELWQSYGAQPVGVCAKRLATQYCLGID